MALTLYAIVDIETTGGHASQNGITEIAIRIWNGEQVIDSFTSLVKPGLSIPLAIQTLTGITDEMVREAPSFADIAPRIFTLLQDKIFVAHQVNFDYSFVHGALRHCGFGLRAKKLCTVRLARKILPGMASYSLGRLTAALEISHQSKHRAGGDADATVTLFQHLQTSDTEHHIPRALREESSLSRFPTRLDPEVLNNLPEKIGIYYFKDQKGKVIYVGKAINIKKRVLSHFSGNSGKKQKQEFITQVERIDTQLHPTELHALVAESQEIKKLWPSLNRAQKKREATLGFFNYQDQKGFIRFGIDKVKPSFTSYLTFHQYSYGMQVLQTICERFALAPEFCSLIKKKKGSVLDSPPLSPESLPLEKEFILSESCPMIASSVEAYNERAEKAIDFLRKDRSFVLLDTGFTPKDQSCIVVIGGEWIGMGTIPIHRTEPSIWPYLDQLQPVRSNGFIRQAVFNHALHHPDKVILLEETEGMKYSAALSTFTKRLVKDGSRVFEACRASNSPDPSGAFNLSNSSDSSGETNASGASSQEIHETAKQTQSQVYSLHMTGDRPGTYTLFS